MLVIFGCIPLYLHCIRSIQNVNLHFICIDIANVYHSLLARYKLYVRGIKKTSISFTQPLMVGPCELLQQFPRRSCDAHRLSRVLLCGGGVVLFGGAHGDVHVDLKEVAQMGPGFVGDMVIDDLGMLVEISRLTT